MEKGFVVLDCDLSPERRFCGARGQGVATYKELMRNLSTRTKPDGGALQLVLDRWAATMQENELALVLSAMQEQVHGFDFSQALLHYWHAVQKGDDEMKSRVLRWFRGEYATKTAAKQALSINLIVTDDNWYDFLKLIAAFLVQAGYAGMMLMVDELVNIYRIPHRVTRQYNYEKILSLYNDTLQGKAKHIGILMCVTPQALEDSDKGIFSYDALRSRLAEGRFSTPGVRDLLAPIIRLEPLSYEELMVLAEKLSSLHAGLYDYVCDITQEEYLHFLKAEFERIGAAQHITPREVIRDFIELLNLTYQNPEKRIGDILREGGFDFSQNTQTEEGIHAEFAAFEV
jgi:hypothetical protein